MSHCLGSNCARILTLLIAVTVTAAVMMAAPPPASGQEQVMNPAKTAKGPQAEDVETVS